jgi:hypothetical protein
MATTTHDWMTDVRKHVPNANDAAVNGIIKHLGIALQTTMLPSSLATTSRSATGSASRS